MMTNNCNNIFYKKKIGIWGFGIVGQSALQYFQQQNPTSIEILDTKKINLESHGLYISTTLQNQESITLFLENNDYIIASPGIKLHAYKKFAHKFISELDLIAPHFKGSTVAITGTIGKTSITHLLTQIIKATHKNTIAVGNIGTPMLSLLTNQQDHAILELSSFQLQQTQLFAPNLAIITNFYPNHLDHHQSLEEYLQAKCNILKFQNINQQALVPLELAEDIIDYVQPQKNWVFFSTTQPTNKELEKYHNHTIFYLVERKVYSTTDNQAIFNLNTLPALTFDSNWLIIIAACKLYNIKLETLESSVQTLQLPEHRLQKIGSWKNCNFYNDSKATVWQATLQAVNAMNNKPIALFLGGLSKGADREPLFQALQGKNIVVYAFGKEAEQITEFCKKFQFQHSAHATLDAAWLTCIHNLKNNNTEILFSPGGSSFDLFPNYQARGQYFTKLVNDFLHKQTK